MNSRKEKEVIKRNAELKQQLAANARKLKIEAGLEKVRAVALKIKNQLICWMYAKPFHISYKN